MLHITVSLNHSFLDWFYYARPAVDETLDTYIEKKHKKKSPRPQSFHEIQMPKIFRLRRIESKKTSTIFDYVTPGQHLSSVSFFSSWLTDALSQLADHAVVAKHGYFLRRPGN